jgi:hypothetical protein
MSKSCRGVRSTGNCGCEGYAYERTAGAYEECFCGHAKGTHIFGEVKNDNTVNPEPEGTTEVVAGTSKGKARRTESVPRKLVQPRDSKVSAVLTPAEARAKLKAAGHPVGQRGRLSPAQLALAATL